ncbi:MAG: flippase [Patescibacteria group bacterium]|jgi:O-antigen/teichoic acid export membrane protein
MPKASLTKNTTYYTAALTFQKILAFIYFWFISNSLFPGQLGQYVFALSFTTIFSIFVDLGLSPVLTREASKSQAEANLYLKNIIGLKIPLAVLAFSAALITISLTAKSAESIVLVFLASFIMVLDSFSLTFWVIFRARQIMKYESIATILVQLIIFTLGLIALKTTGQVRYLIMALLAASSFNFLLSLSLLKIKLKFSLAPRYDKKVVKHFLKIIPAFALAGIFIKIYNASDSVLLGYLSSEEAVGFYAVPAKVVYALQQVIPAAFAAVIFPAFSFYYVNSKELLAKTFNKAFSYLTIASLPLAAGIIALAPDIIDTIWPSYHDVIPTFFAMSLAIPFIFLAFPTGYLLNACDRQKVTTINRGIITTLAVVLNIILIPVLSYLGAGITFFITNFILLFMDLWWVRKVIPLNDWHLSKIVFKSTLACLVMIAAILAIKPYFNLLISVPFGAIVYFASLYLFKGFTWEEFTELAKKGLKK